MAPSKSSPGTGIFINQSTGDIVDLLLKELDHYKSQAGKIEVASVYFVGKATPDSVGKILGRIHKHWSMKNKPEITVAAYSQDKYDLKGLQDAGANRINWAFATVKDLEVTCSLYDNVGVDIFYNRASALQAVQETLSAMFALPLTHLSLYEDFSGDTANIYDMGADLLADHGFHKYDPFHFAKDGYESVHQNIYNSYGDYMGIGPGSHGRFPIKGVFYGIENDAPTWRARVQDKGHGAKSMVALNEADLVEEIVLQTLGTAGGLPQERAKTLLGKPVVKYLNAASLNVLKSEGFLEDHANTVRATPRGQLLVTTLAEKMVA